MYLFLVVFRVAHTTRTTTKMNNSSNKQREEWEKKEMCGIKIVQMPSTLRERKKYFERFSFLFIFFFFIWTAAAAAKCFTRETEENEAKK